MSTRLPDGATAVAYLDDGPGLPCSLTLEPSSEQVTTGGSMPDPAWEHTDDAGHWHSWTADRELPTLNRAEKRVPCDGSCGGVCEGEGYTRAEYTCRICGEVIQPGTIPGPHTIHVPGPVEWQVQVRGGPGTFPVGSNQVTVRVEAADRIRFGVAGLTEVEAESRRGEPAMWSAVLSGIGPLGVRTAPRLATAGTSR